MNRVKPPTRTCRRCGESKPHKARGLCSNCYDQAAGDYAPERAYRPFTAAERALIRRDWGARTAAQIAADLGRDVQSVRAAAVRFGARRPRPASPRTDARLRARMVKLHGEGLSDRQIARRVGRSHGTVIRWLRALGLPSNSRRRPTDPWPPRDRLRLRAAALDRIRRDGLEEAVACVRRHAEGRAAARKLGWPQAETLLEARILDALHEHGASTADQLLADLGDRRRSWTLQVLRGLRRRGLVAVLYREGHYAVYGLAHGLRREPPKAENGREPRPLPVPRGEGTPARRCTCHAKGGAA